MVLDANLPTYFFRPSTDRSNRYDYSLLFTQYDSEPDPRYTLRYPDPASPISKNCYAVALFDSYIMEMLYGEILLKPDWTQPTLSAQEIRQNTGVPPAPVPVIPQDFVIQLYNPDQQIVVTEKVSSWGSNTYSFAMPQFTFRAPSGSSLDRGTNDPTADVTTPRLKFMWKKEGKLSNNLVCYLTGKSTDTHQKKKGGKEPDIAIALLTNYRDLTIYESNFHRVDMEDYKGLELVLLLSAAAIKDIYCGQRKDAFNIGENARKNSAGLGKKKSMPLLAGGKGASTQALVPTNSRPGPVVQSNSYPMSTNQGRKPPPPPSTAANSTAPPPPDPRAQWEIDAETARLRKQQDAEKRASDTRRREREKAEELERKRLMRMVEAEEKARRKRDAEVDKETARLIRQYGDQSTMMPKRPTPQRDSAPPGGWAAQRPPRPPPLPQNSGGPYLAPSGATPAASMSSFFHGQPGSSGPKQKKSFLRLRRMSDEGQPSLNKKKSSFW